MTIFIADSVIHYNNEFRNDIITQIKLSFIQISRFLLFW